MSNYKIQSHSVYLCQYHVIFCPKYRHRVLKDRIKSKVVRELYQISKGFDLVEIEELNVQEDHVHMMISIAPKHCVAEIIGRMKGKCTIRLFKEFEYLRKICRNKGLWSRGYCVSTVGLNEEQIRKYIVWQEKKEREWER